ncbi:MAG: citrate/2-methylcitrate synthase [Nitrososphaerota archaeon]
MTENKVFKGLEGVYVAESKLSLIDGENSKLYYVGYDVEELAEKSCYEEVVFLLFNQRLPTRMELEDFTGKMVRYRSLWREQLEFIDKFDGGVEPLGLLSSLLLISYDIDSRYIGDDYRERAVRLVSLTASGLAAIIRKGMGLDWVKPNPSLGHAANFLYMITGEVPSREDSEILEKLLILQAEHGLPASTFAALVTASTMADLYSSLVSGLLALRGPLHVGASEAAHDQLTEIGSPDRVEEWFNRAMSEKRRIMGFGHRVYRTYDPRARILRGIARRLANSRGGEIRRLYEVAARLEEVGIKHLAPRGIYPNVDYWSPIIYTALGIPKRYYTLMYAMSRVAGIVAHVLEYWTDNKLIRPLHLYTGEYGRKYIPIEQR